MQLSPAVLTALIDGDLAAAERRGGSPAVARSCWPRSGCGGSAGIRSPVIRPARTGSRGRLVDAETGLVVGHGGFHGPPDDDGMVEVAYSVDPAFRRRGYAKAILPRCCERADADPAVRAVRASIRPDNAGSLATIAGFGFRKVGEQWDPEDGLEFVFQRAASGAVATTSGRWSEMPACGARTCHDPAEGVGRRAGRPGRGRAGPSGCGLG